MHPLTSMHARTLERWPFTSIREEAQSGVNISDRSDGLRSGMQYLNIDHTAPDEEECATPHCSDWAHIVTHLKKGVTWSSSNEFE